MKVLSVLLCFVLAHGVTASIFQQNRHRNDLDIERLDYNNQHQRPRNQYSGDRKHTEQQVSSEQHQARSEEWNQEYSPREQNDKQYQRHYSSEQNQRRQSNEESQNQQWQQHYNSKYNRDQQQRQPQRYQSYQNPTRHSQYPASFAQQSQEHDKPYSSYQQSSFLDDEQKSNHRSSSSSSESESKESKEKRNFYKSIQISTQHSDQKWASSQQSSAQDSEMTNDDTVQWKQLKMSVGPNISVQDKENIQKIFSDAQRAMKHLTDEEKMKYHQVLDQQQSSEEETNVILNATQMVQRNQYPVEEHKVKTDDGYELTVFRIPPKKSPRGLQKSPVVFLMHGILGSADDWIVKGSEDSLAYLLSDAGYDVWLGNSRGNKYSQQHVSKSPATPDFWQFCTDEIALHDMPAMIDYVLKTTNEEKMYYIGHSFGTTAFFALVAAHPEYNDKIRHMFALSPMVYMTNVRSPLIRMIAPTSKFQNILQRQLGNGPFAPSKDLTRTLGGDLLLKETGSKKVASNIYNVMAGFNANDEDLPKITTVMQHIPAGTSSKVVRHYSQGVNSQEFQRYDYGPALNQKVYGSEQPPKYDVQKVETPVTLYYSEEDWLAHPKDVERLKNELPNVKEAYQVPDKHFANQDFQFSSKAPEMVYKRLIESMQKDQ